jgi:hypothetical protein
MRRTLHYFLTPEDKATHAKWVRVVAIFYGIAALLLLLAAVTLPSASPVQPRGSAALAAPSAGHRPTAFVGGAAQSRDGAACGVSRPARRELPDVRAGE